MEAHLRERLQQSGRRLRGRSVRGWAPCGHALFSPSSLNHLNRTSPWRPRSRTTPHVLPRHFCLRSRGSVTFPSGQGRKRLCGQARSGRDPAACGDVFITSLFLVLYIWKSCQGTVALASNDMSTISRPMAFSAILGHLSLCILWFSGWRNLLSDRFRLVRGQ